MLIFLCRTKTSPDTAFSGKNGLPMPGLSGTANGPIGKILAGSYVYSYAYIS